MDIARRVAPNRTGFTPVENGTRQIYWEYFGQGDREVVVLLNGLAMLTRSWYRIVPYLDQEYDVLLYDYFGQGQSSKEDEPYFIDRFAGYLIAVMDGLNIEKVHPVGVSYGGFIAAELGRLYQERLHTLTLSGILLTRETLFQMYQDLSLRFYTEADPPAFDIYTQYMYEKIYGESLARAIYGEQMEATRQKFYKRYADKRWCLIRLTEAQKPFFENIDKDPNAYRGIMTPTILLTGDQDRAIPYWQQAKIPQILPNCRQIMVKDSGHMTYLEQPEFFWTTVKRFMAAKTTGF